MKKTYSHLMKEYPAHIVLRIETEEPIELGDFVKAFTSLASEYEKFVKRVSPNLQNHAQIYVREVRAGSIEADLIPWLVVAAPWINDMEKILIVEDFVRLWGSRITALISGKTDDQPQTKSELQAFSDAVEAIANDPNGYSELEVATFEDGKRKVRAAFKFNTIEARKARVSIEDRSNELNANDYLNRERALMTFSRSDKDSAKIGKYSGELVVVEEISKNRLPLVYGSELAERRIKHEIREAHDNIYKKGFIVDVNVKHRNGRPVAYSVTNLHQVIDLPDEES